MKKIFVIILLTVMASSPLLAKDNLSQIQQAIESKNANWTAGENPISKLSKEEFRRLLGTNTWDLPPNAEEKFIELPQSDSIPANLDWRDNNGNWMTSVKNQGGCGSCWDFSAVGQIESWWKIHYDYPDSNIDLSEQYILSCGSQAGSCSGGWPYAALEFVKTNEIPHEEYMPYKASDDMACTSVSEGWLETAVTIPGWGFITLEEAQVVNIKNALMHHPVSASYDVYEDFSYYNGGVYEHSWGQYEGGHAIMIVGWEDENQCWICKNSWGPYWGENGYFRIKWGNCNIGKNIPFIYDKIVNNVQLSFSQDTVKIELAAGTSATENLQITNETAQTIDLYVSDSQDPVLFHQSSFNAYEGQSWWCGVKETQGYENHWLQYLETPRIDLSSTVSPELNFMAKWSIETSGGAEAPYDGWDGWNVWISTDNGENFTVIEPESPAYHNAALWAFGHPEQGWNMGTSVKGWSGYSHHWENVKFDLSDYAGENIILRFAFASDMGYSTPDDATLQGLFLDNISIDDNGTIIFLDTAGTNSEMSPTGYGDLENDWLDFYYNNNRLANGASLDLSLNFTAPVQQGLYSGRINFLSNNNNRSLPALPVQLRVLGADDDLAVEGIIYSDFVINPLISQPVGANIFNNGNVAHSNVEIVLSESTGEFSESQLLDDLAPGEIKTVWFEADWLANLSDTELIVTINQADGVSKNNQDTISATVFDQLDGFEKYNNFWGRGANCHFTYGGAFDGLYGMTFSADESAQFYTTYKKALKITDNDLYFEFHGKTKTSETACLIFDFSYDQDTWFTGDTIAIDTTGYAKFEFLQRFPAENDGRAWFRIRAVVPAGNSLSIDNLFVKKSPKVAIADEEPTAEKFMLLQNYPNPFNPATRIGYQIPKKSRVDLGIYDITGKLIEKLVTKEQPAGFYEIQWNAGQYASGIYFYKLSTEAGTKTLKMMLMK